MYIKGVRSLLHTNSGWMGGWRADMSEGMNPVDPSPEAERIMGLMCKTLGGF